MNGPSQSQKAGARSTNTQISTQNNFGVSYDEVRQIALDTFKANFYDFAGEAKTVAEDRARAITEETLEHIFKANPKTLSNFADPDIATALLQAQKCHARSGENGAKEVLIELIAQRSQNNKRTSKNILLNEAIKKMETLGQEHLEFLHVYKKSVSLDFKALGPIQMARHLKDQFNTISHALPAANLKETRDFLEYTGMLNVRAGTRPTLCKLLKQHFYYMFTNGISINQIDINNLSPQQHSTIWYPLGLIGDQTCFALAHHQTRQKEFLIKNGWNDKECDHLIKLNKSAQMSQVEIKRFILQHFSDLDRLLAFREAPELISCELTPVAKLIAENVSLPPRA